MVVVIGEVLRAKIVPSKQLDASKSRVFCVPQRDEKITRYDPIGSLCDSELRSRAQNALGDMDGSIS